MRRREFITIFGGAAAAWPLAAHAQQPLAISGTRSKVNVRDFGAIGDGAHDDTPAIQAAIDFAYSNGRSTIYVPAGNYKTTVPLFLDPPQNMRGNPAAWRAGTTYASGAKVTYLGVPWKSLANGNVGNTPAMSSTHWQIDLYHGAVFGFSLNFEGDNAAGSWDNVGANIRPNFHNGVALYVGPGQACRIAGLNILGPNNEWPNYRASRNPNSQGIALAAQDAGVTRTLIERCCVANFYTCVGIATVSPGGGLGDSTTLVKCRLSGGAYGVLINSTQAYANSLYDCVIDDCNICVASMYGTGANVFGGNFSPGLSLGTKMTCGNFTNFVTGNQGNDKYYTFDCALSAPAWDAGTWYDWKNHTNPGVVSYGGKLWFAFYGQSGNTPNATHQPWVPLEKFATGNVLRGWMFETANFGLVPCIITAYNPDTQVASFTTSHYYWGGQRDMLAGSPPYAEFAADLSAATTVYAAELPEVLHGGPINAYGLLIEELLPGPIKIIDTEVGFAGGRPCTIEGFTLDSPPDCYIYAPDYGGGYPAQPYAQAEYRAGMLFPTFSAGSSNNLTCRNCTFGAADAITIFTGGPTITFEGCTATGMLNGVNDWVRTDRSLTGPHLEGASNASIISEYLGNVPHQSWRPAPNVLPTIRLTQAQTLLSGALPALQPTNTGGSTLWSFSPYVEYALLCGGVNYQVSSDGYPPNQNFAQRVSVISGRSGAGNIAYSGAQAGDVIVWATDLTNQVDAISYFSRVVTTGGQIQQLSASDLSTTKFQICIKTPNIIRSNHSGYSYGQNLTTTNVPNLSWRCKHHSLTVYANIELLLLMFPGLYVGLSTEGTTRWHYVTRVYRHLGYFEISTDGAGHYLGGSPGSTYTGTTVYQQPYVLSVI